MITRLSFATFIETVRNSDIQPDGRRNAATNSLVELLDDSIIPSWWEANLADLKSAWEAVSHAAQEGEPVPVQKRRELCGELAALCPTDTVRGLAAAIQVWETWVAHWTIKEKAEQDLIVRGRLNAMLNTLKRELEELRAA